MRSFYRILATGVILTSIVSSTSMAVERPAEKSFVTRSPAVGKNGMAATSQPLATLAAIEILQAGGNAIDAAIAANAVLGVTEPMSCGLGGDLFAIVWDAKTKHLYGLNASGRSPRGLALEEFQRRKLRYVPTTGPLSVSVPGCVDGWAELHQRFGKLPLATILASAIRHARDGFPVTQVIAHSWKGIAPAFRQQAGFAEVFLIDGHALRMAKHSAIPRSPSRWSKSPKVAATPSTAAPSPMRSTTTSATPAASFVTKTLPGTNRNGSTR